MDKYLKYIVFLFFIFICSIGTYLFMNNIEHGEDITYTSEILIFANGNEYEVKINNKEKVTIFRENDVEEIIYRYPREGKPRISLPNLNQVVGEDILQGKETILDYTYNIKFSDGCKYLKYLIDNGYSVEMYISTSQYLELFLQKDGLYKRLVLFKDTLMICNLLENTELPNIWEYLKSYNYNNYIENKFGIEIKK